MSDDLLRPLTLGDAAELHTLVEANRSRLARWMPWAADQTADGTAAFIRRSIEQERNEDGFQRAVIAEDAIAGTAGFHRIDRPYEATSIGYWLGEEYEGRGLMMAAVTRLIDHAFGVWALHRIELRIAPDNERSRALAARLGFREEGLLREMERIGDEYRDLVMYSLLADEWPARTAR